MDVNGTRFHLLLGRNDWLGAAAPDGDAEWNDATQTMGLRGRQFIFPSRQLERAPTAEQRRGAACDRYGNWYWVDDSRTRILFRGHHSGTETFWDADREAAAAGVPADVPGAFTECRPARVAEPWVMATLAVTDDHYLLVALARPRGIAVFDLRSGGPPVRHAWPDDVPFAPFDMAPRPGGGAWILDAANQCCWELDRFFRVLARHRARTAGAPRDGDFTPTHPLDGASAAEATGVRLSPRITADMAIPLGVANPVAIEAMPDGTILVLGADTLTGAATVCRHRREQRLECFSLADAGAQAEVRANCMPALDLAFVPDAGAALAGRVYLVAADGNQAFAFDLRPAEGVMTLAFHRAFFPMRRFGGKALVASRGDVYYDADDRWLPLVEQPQPLYGGEATVQLPPGGDDAAFDGREPQCVWHRLFLDGCVPPGTGVRVQSRAADRREDLAHVPWDEEPQPYLRADGAEVPMYRAPVSDAPDRAGTWELLFQRARGRYLQLRLAMTGTGRATPRLQSLRVYYPRFSYLDHYLPAVYREDAASASFLDRFLANIEGFFTVTEGRVAQVQELFDTRTVPAELLGWLAGWFGVQLDAAWPEATRRLFIRYAPQMLRERGTRAGLVRSLRLALDPCVDESLFDPCADGSCAGQPRFTIRIVERFLTRSAPGVVFGDPTDVSGPGASTDALAWTPAQGAEPLHARYRAFVEHEFGGIGALNDAWGTHYTGFDDPALRLGATPPPGAEAAVWRRFMSDRLGFTYAVPRASDASLYRDFLARRYKQVADLDAAYGVTGAARRASFATVTLPVAMPSGGRALQDWILFVSVVLPTWRNAHRFTVLVPVSLDDHPERQRTRLELARRVTESARPSHTAFDVRGYWAAFRVGEARLGLDTQLGRGSRFAALLLGRGLLGESALGYPEPYNAPDRLVLDRDTLTPRRRTSNARMT